jgi:PBP1b-binding outer membrane lipoprotein LpoB
MMQMTKIVFLVALAATFSASCAQSQQNSYSKSTEDTIQMVENGLSGAVQIQDSANTWNIEERMKAKGINGVSVAVIRNYKIDWA